MGFWILDAQECRKQFWLMRQGQDTAMLFEKQRQWNLLPTHVQASARDPCGVPENSAFPVSAQRLIQIYHSGVQYFCGVYFHALARQHGLI